LLTGGRAVKPPPAGKRRLWEKNQSKTRVFMVYYRSKRRTSILIIRRPTIKKASEMPLEARLGVIGGPLSSRGPKASLAATSGARKAIVDD
jgi:hypothetical protein